MNEGKGELFFSHARVQRLFWWISFSLLCIGIRLWHLSVVQREERLTRSHQYKRHYSSIEPAMRGIICDRLGEPLVINHTQYNACISFLPILQLEKVAFRKGEGGKRERYSPRKEYVERLLLFLKRELSLNQELLEKRLQFIQNHTPLSGILYEGLSERQFFRLKMAEREWVGLRVEQVPRRKYLFGKMASHLLGYMGSIDQRYWKSLKRREALYSQILLARRDDPTHTLPESITSSLQLSEKLQELRERMYRITDSVGKSGIESVCEESLRGWWGRKKFETDREGKRVYALPQVLSPIDGKKCTLTLFAQLQNYAEELLIAHEPIREGKSRGKRGERLDQPPIKGGAIVVMDPFSGDLLALASHPRFDPNDFVHSPSVSTEREQKLRIGRWMGSPSSCQKMWNGELLLMHEVWNKREQRVEEREEELTWPLFLRALFPSNHSLLSILSSLTLQEAVSLLQDRKEIAPTWYSLLSQMDRDRVQDLLHLALAHPERFSPMLLQKVGSFSLFYHRCLQLHFYALEREILQQLRERISSTERWEELSCLWQNKRLFFLLSLFSQEFSPPTEKDEWTTFCFEQIGTWRRERASSSTAYLSLSEPFSSLGPALLLSYLSQWRSFEELEFPLYGSHFHFSKRLQTGRELVICALSYLEPRYQISRAFQGAEPIGSLFKGVVAYEALMEKYRTLIREGKKVNAHSLNPLVIWEQSTGSQATTLGFFENGKSISHWYRGGRLIPSVEKNLGRLDLLRALENSSNPYFSLLAASLPDPNQLIRTARRFSLGQRSGFLLGGESTGILPDDLSCDPSGLYAFAIGQHHLRGTPLQIALLFSALANGGKVMQPRLLHSLRGSRRLYPHESAFFARNRMHKTLLQRVGIHFPLFILGNPVEQEEEELFPIRVREEVELPPEVRHTLFEGFRRVIAEKRGMAPERLSSYPLCSREMEIYREMRPYLIGKSGTAEASERVRLFSKAQNYSHLWFASILFDRPLTSMRSFQHSRPELVIVVYLPFGDYGKEAIFLVTQMAKKWRQIRRENATC